MSKYFNFSVRILTLLFTMLFTYQSSVFAFKTEDIRSLAGMSLSAHKRAMEGEREASKQIELGRKNFVKVREFERRSPFYFSGVEKLSSSRQKILRVQQVSHVMRSIEAKVEGSLSKGEKRTLCKEINQQLNAFQQDPKQKEIKVKAKVGKKTFQITIKPRDINFVSMKERIREGIKLLEINRRAYSRVLEITGQVQSILGIQSGKKNIKGRGKRTSDLMAAISYTQLLADAKFLLKRHQKRFEEIKARYAPQGALQRIRSSLQRGNILRDFASIAKKALFGMFIVGSVATPVVQGVSGRQPVSHRFSKRAITVSTPSPPYQTMEDTPVCFGGNNTVTISGISSNETATLRLNVSPFQNGNLTVNSKSSIPGVTNPAVDRVHITGNTTHIRSVMESGKVCFEPAPEFSGNANIRAIAYIGLSNQDLKDFSISVTEVPDPTVIQSAGFSVNDPNQVIKYQEGKQVVATDPDTPPSGRTVFYTGMKHIRVYRTTAPTLSIFSHPYDATDVEYKLDGSGKQPEMTYTVGDGVTNSTMKANIAANFPQKQSLVVPLVCGGTALVVLAIGGVTGVHLYKRNKVFRDHTWEGKVHQKLGLKCSVYSANYLLKMDLLRAELNKGGGSGDESWFSRQCADDKHFEMLVNNTVYTIQNFEATTDRVGKGSYQGGKLFKKNAINYSVFDGQLSDLASQIKSSIKVDKGHEQHSESSQEKREMWRDEFGDYEEDGFGYVGSNQGAGSTFSPSPAPNKEQEMEELARDDTVVPMPNQYDYDVYIEGVGEEDSDDYY